MRAVQERVNFFAHNRQGKTRAGLVLCARGRLGGGWGGGAAKVEGVVLSSAFPSVSKLSSIVSLLLYYNK